jgi:hypothetical protein
MAKDDDSGRFEAVVLGAGPAGEVVATASASAGYMALEGLEL